MTVSRKESESVLLQMIAEGDGDYVLLNDLQSRSVLVLKDLNDHGHIDGTTFINGTARYRITASGEKYLSEIQRELIDEEAGHLVRPDEPISWSTIWKWVGLVGSSAIGIVGFVWFMLSQVIAPSAYCPKLPEGLKTWLAPCESHLSDEN